MGVRGKKLTALLGVAVMTASLLSGCGSASENSESTADTQTAQENAAATENQENTGDTVTISMWGWDEGTITNVAKEFNKEYPNIQIEYIPVSGGSDYTQKVQTSVASGMELPDILWQDYKQRGVLYEMDIWEDLSADPYNYDTEKMFPYCVQSTCTRDGKIVGVEWFMNATGLSYKKDLCEKWIGTADSAELEKMIQSWDDFIEIGKKVKEDSNGTVYMFSSAEDAMAMISGNFYESAPSVIDENNKLDLEGTYGESLAILKKMIDAGIVNNLSQNSAAANASYADENNIFYCGVTWSPHYSIEPNDPNSADRWGLMVSPGVAFNLGGTAMGITNTSQHKEEAWTFIHWLTQTENGAYACRDSSSYLTNLMSIYETDDYLDYTISCYGDIKAGKVWADDISPYIEGAQVSQYDALLDEVGHAVCEAMIKDPSLTVEDALGQMEEQIKAKAPELYE